MREVEYSISDALYEQLTEKFNKAGKNSHIEQKAIAIAKEYFLTIQPDAQILPGNGGGDLIVRYEEQDTLYEIKGTEANDIAFSKLKVSSQACHDSLEAGMELLRICKVGQKTVRLFFMKLGEDFLLKVEPRWGFMYPQPRPRGRPKK